jgi:hypothetical protein
MGDRCGVFSGEDSSTLVPILPDTRSIGNLQSRFDPGRTTSVKRYIVRVMVLGRFVAPWRKPAIG